MTGERSEDARDRARTALAHVLMEYDAGRIVVEPEPGMAVPPGGKPTRFHRAWADAILTALAADRLALSGITETVRAVLRAAEAVADHPESEPDTNEWWDKVNDLTDAARAVPTAEYAALREKP